MSRSRKRRSVVSELIREVDAGPAGHGLRHSVSQAVLQPATHTPPNADLQRVIIRSAFEVVISDGAQARQRPEIVVTESLARGTRGQVADPGIVVGGIEL